MRIDDEPAFVLHARAWRETSLLVEVLTEYTGASRPFSLIYPGNRHMPLRVRVLIDYLVGALGR